MTSRILLHAIQGSVCIEVIDGSVLVTVATRDDEFQVEADAEKRGQLREMLSEPASTMGELL